MTGLRYRRATAEDVPAMADVFFAAAPEMFARYNIAVAPPPRPVVLMGYEHIRSTGFFDVAELDGKIVAIAGGIVRDKLWFLSGFWVRPGLQRQKIGMPLLRRVFEYGKEAGVEAHFVWSSPDVTAMASYLKLGMLPGFQILIFEGTPERIEPAAGYSVEPLEKRFAMGLDQIVRGTPREVDHDYWSGPMGFTGRQVVRGGRAVGYFYHGRGGVGPGAWERAEDGEAVVGIALSEAAAGGTPVRLIVPGINHTAIRFALGAGLQFSNAAHFLTTRPFGRMEQYLASGPGMF